MVCECGSGGGGACCGKRIQRIRGREMRIEDDMSW